MFYDTSEKWVINPYDKYVYNTWRHYQYGTLIRRTKERISYGSDRD